MREASIGFGGPREQTEETEIREAPLRSLRFLLLNYFPGVYQIGEV